MADGRDDGGFTQQKPSPIRKKQRLTDPTDEPLVDTVLSNREMNQVAASVCDALSQEAKSSDDLMVAVPELPEEITVEILSRLTVKCLVRLRCVCKSWKTLISDCHFIRKHLQVSVADPNYDRHKIILSSTNPKFGLTHCSVNSVYNEPHTDTLDIEYASKKERRFDWVVGTCNGLVCVAIKQDSVLLVNPSLRVFKSVAISGVRPGGYTVYGFGYVRSSDDYKVVAVLCYLGDTGTYETDVKVYSVRTGSCKRIQGFPVGVPLDDAGKYVSGTINWAACPDNGWGASRCIVSLNLKNDNYSEIPLPVYEDVNFEATRLGVLGGCLSLLFDYPGIRADVWVMKEYGVKESWNKLITIPYLTETGFRYSTPAFMTSNGEILLEFGWCIAIYNSKDNTVRYPVIRGIDFCHDVEIYVESLVSPL